MNYHNITHDDMLNGDGLRVVLWMAGCSHHCSGCQNPVTWNPNDGIPFDRNAWEEIEDQLEKDYIEGITFSGGDPLFKGNQTDVTTLCKNNRNLLQLWRFGSRKEKCLYLRRTAPNSDLFRQNDRENS